MTTQLVAQTQPAAPVEVMKYTAEDIKANVALIQSVLKSVFIEDVHYGIIPGTDKPTLLKPGAEKIMVTFRLNGKPMIEDLSKEDEIRYRVAIRVTHQVTQLEIGWGVGECSSNETKYKWIKADASTWESTPENLRRIVNKTSRDGKAYSIQQVRANIADVANTVLKMAKKRALIDATLTCTAASDVFAQDLEEMDPELAKQIAQEKRPPMPQASMNDKPAATGTTAPQQQELPKRQPNLAGAREMAAKFTAPCKLCGTPINAGDTQLYIPEGPDKGPYHFAHRASA